MPETQKNNSSLRRLTKAGLAFLVLHFIMTIGYTVHGLGAQRFAKAPIQSYMTPMFHQGWTLFVPVPGFQNTLSYRTYTDGSWSEIVDASTMSSTKHRKINYAAQKVAKQLANEIGKGLYYVGEEPALDRVKHAPAYVRAVFFCGMHWKHETGALPDSIQLTLGYIITPDFYSGKKEVDDVEFHFEPDGL